MDDTNEPTVIRREGVTASGLQYVQWTRQEGPCFEAQRWYGPHHQAPAEPDPRRWVLEANDFSADGCD